MKKPFEQYDQENPQVWREFKRLALLAKATGRKHYSAKGIIEVVRWHTTVTANDGEFKVNNNYTADYARKMIKNFPVFEGFFQLRERK